ncbi:MAG: HAD family phosphatase [Clostridiaceae bacterium]|nr:HAD family phosphatase [Clostridiaceae bacterium]
MIKALVFDMDGVIIDSEPLQIEIIVQVLKQLGGNSKPEEIYEFVGATNDELWATLKKRHNIKKSVKEILEIHDSYKKKRFPEAKLETVEGIPELIKEAKRKGLKIALATSSTKFLAEYILKRFDIYQYFNILVTADDISNSKPNPEIYIKAANLLGVNSDECIAIEDAHLGVKAAKAAGMKCIAYVNPNSGKQDLTDADIIVSSIKDIELDRIQNLF